MGTETQDVKTVADSSTAAEGSVASSETKVTPQSEQGVKQPESMADIAAQVAKDHGIGAEKQPDSAKEGETKAETETGGEKKEEVAAEGEKTKDEEAKVEEGKLPENVPYERFREVNEKAKDFEAKFSEAEPYVKSQREIVEYCRNNGISQAQFSEGLQLLTLMNTDPAKAVEHMTGLIEQLQGYTGDKLPEDLQEKVGSGKLDIEDAKEIASLRAKAKFVESKVKQTEASQQRAVEERFLREVHSATSSWEQRTAKTDPDMRKGTEKYQMVLDKYRALSDERGEKGEFVHPIRTVEEHMKLLDAAYQAVEKFARGLTKGVKPNAHKVLTSTTSSVTAEVEPKSMLDIARQVGSKHGISI